MCLLLLLLQAVPQYPTTVLKKRVKHLPMARSHVCCIPARVCACMCAWIQDCKNFQKIQKPPQNSRCQKDDIKQVPFRGSTNIRHYHAKFSYHSDLAPSSCAYLYEDKICEISCSWNQHITVLLYVVVNPLCCASSVLHRIVLLFSSTPVHLSIIECCVSQSCSTVEKFLVFEELYGSLYQ